MGNSAKSWGIIGGGMLGMTLAWRLARQGQQVTLLESAPQFGGLTTAWRLGDVVWDRFYHVVLLSDSHLRALLREIGLQESLKWVTARTGFYSDGQLYSLSSSWEFLWFPRLSLWQKMRLAATIWYGSKVTDYRALEGVTVEDWLIRLSGRATYERLWLPLLRSKLGELYRQTSAAFIWAYICRMYKARRTGLKRDLFGYAPGGYARILDCFCDALESVDVELRPDHAVRQVSLRPGKGEIIVDFEGRESRSFERVISTVPSPLVSQTTPQLTTQEHQRLNGIKYLGVICASVLLKRPLAGYYVTNITDENVPLTGIIEMSAIVDAESELGGHHLVYLPKYVASDDREAFAESDDSIRRRLLDTLQHMYPHFQRADVVDFKVARARYVMSLPTLNYSNHLPEVVTSIPGYYVINSAQIVKGNLNVNETIQVGDECLAKCLEHDRQSSLTPPIAPRSNVEAARGEWARNGALRSS